MPTDEEILSAFGSTQKSPSDDDILAAFGTPVKKKRPSRGKNKRTFWQRFKDSYGKAKTAFLKEWRRN